MARAQHRGKTPTDDQDVSRKDYLAGLLSQNISQSTIDTLIADGLAPYADKTYVDTRDALNATQAYVDAGDATRLHLSERNANSGIAGLDATGKADLARLNVASTQRWPKPFYSPSSYNATTVTATDTETAVYPVPIADPGFTYKLLISGAVDTSTSVDGSNPLIKVRVGSTTGAVVASGVGSTETPQGIGLDDFERVDATGIGTSLWSSTYLVGTSANGATAIPDGHQARWVAGTDGFSARMLHRRIAAADALTAGDDQVVTLTEGTITTESGNDPETTLCVRMSSDGTSYVFVSLQPGKLQWGYRKNGTFTNVGGTVSTTRAAGTVWTLTASARVFTIARNGVAVGSGWNDTGAVSNMGASYRGWGWGHFAPQFGFQQTSPASVASISIGAIGGAGLVAPTVIQPVGLAAQSALTGAQTLYVCLSRPAASSATVSALATNPQIHVVPIPA